MKKEIVIKNDKDLLNFLENIDNLEYLEDREFKLSGTLLQLRLEGDGFKSSLPGSFITGLAQYQEKLYRVYLKSKYGIGTKRKPTTEEAKLLEIKVTVKQGSTEVVIRLLLDSVGEVLSKMPADQVLPAVIGVAGIIAVAYCVKGIGSVAVKEVFKTKRKTLKEKKALSDNELEKKKYEFLESTVNTAIEAIRAVSGGIVKSVPSSVSANGKTVSTQNIASIADDLAPEKPEAIENQTVITGTYRIQRVTLDFKKDTASADVFDVETGDPIKGIIVQPKSISDGSYRVLKTAQDQHDVNLQLIVTMRNNNIHRAVLDKILE